MKFSEKKIRIRIRQQGNWKEKSDYELKEGKSDWKLMNAVYRKIEYYDSK